MTTKEKAAGGNRAAFNNELQRHLTARLARTKALLVEAFNFRALGFAESELIASRLRWRYGDAWRGA
jgi:hypothetical protein